MPGFEGWVNDNPTPTHSLQVNFGLVAAKLVTTIKQRVRSLTMSNIYLLREKGPYIMIT